MLSVNAKLKAVRRAPHIGPRWQKQPEWTESKERCVSPLWLDTAAQPHPRWRGVSPTEKKQHCSQKAMAELQIKSAGVGMALLQKQLKISSVLSRRQWLENRRWSFEAEMGGVCLICYNPHTSTNNIEILLKAFYTFYRLISQTAHLRSMSAKAEKKHVILLKIHGVSYP